MRPSAALVVARRHGLSPPARLAMQKVDGSSPFIRSSETGWSRRVFLCPDDAPALGRIGIVRKWSGINDRSPLRAHENVVADGVVACVLARRSE